MKRNAFMLLFILILAYGAFAQQSQSKKSAEDQIAGMNWLAGNWFQEGFESHYTTPEGGKIFSVSRYFSEGKCVFFEWEKFEIQDGIVVVVPYPKGTESVPFQLHGYNFNVRKAVFRNPNHDWPTELSYELVTSDNLLILVSGMQNGKMRTERFDLSRKK